MESGLLLAASLDENDEGASIMKCLSSKIYHFLSRLDQVKQTGQGKWLARCPAHDDRSPSLGIREADDRILIHCFAGCGITEVLQAVGLNMADLFPDRAPDPYGPKTKFPKFSAYELFPLLVHEAVILALAWNDLLIKGSMSDADMQRTLQAFESVRRLHAEVYR